jgi:hypothetical protein
MNEKQLINNMMRDTTHKLEAIYNNCSRNKHNGIQPDDNALMMTLIEVVAGRRGIEITGDTGSYSFFDTEPFNEPMDNIPPPTA